MGELDKALKESVGRYVDIVAEDHVKSSIDQIRNIITKAGSSTFDAKAELEKLLGRWGENGAKKLSMLQAVATANHYARNTYRQLGVKNIRWVAQGGKACQFCRKMNGRTTQIEAPFLPDGKEFVQGFTPRCKVKYPPLHRGCVCAIVPFFDKLAGVERGKPCTPDEALERYNPGIKTGEDRYKKNCPICAGAFEAQMQGYDVVALGFDENATTILLGANDVWTKIWNIPEGMDRHAVVNVVCSTSKEALDILKKQVNEGERYVFSYATRWRIRHVVNITKESGLLILYDGQYSIKYTETPDGRIRSVDSAVEIRDKLAQLKYDASQPHELFRVDNLSFNEAIGGKIFRRRGHHDT